MVSYKGVPTNPVEKDRTYEEFGMLLKHFGIFKENMVIAGLPASRPVQNLTKIVGEENLDKITYHGAEIDESKWLDGVVEAKRYPNINVANERLENVLDNYARDVSAYNLDFCDCLINKEYLNELVEVINKSRSEDSVLIQITHCKRNRQDYHIKVEEYLPKQFNGVKAVIGPNHYKGEMAMYVTYIALNPGKQTKYYSTIGEVLKGYNPAKMVPENNDIQSLQIPKTNLPDLLKYSGMSHVQLANQLGVSEATIANWKKGNFPRKLDVRKKLKKFAKSMNKKLVLGDNPFKGRKGPREKKVA